MAARLPVELPARAMLGLSSGDKTSYMLSYD